MIENKDIASKGHWDEVYENVDAIAVNKGWKPSNYEAWCLEAMLDSVITKYKPKRILEVGCGNSTWLPYIANKYGIEVFGLDYSEKGCAQALKRLEVEGVKSKVWCDDLFNISNEEIGQFDFVYSLGLIEHFEDTENIMENLLNLVNDGGVLLSEVPNLYSIHGLLSYIYQPEQLDKHVFLSPKKLTDSLENLNVSEIEAKHLGVMSFNIVAWGYNQRFPKLDFIILPIARFFIRCFTKIAKRITKKGLIPILSPFVYVTCKKREL